MPGGTLSWRTPREVPVPERGARGTDSTRRGSACLRAFAGGPAWTRSAMTSATVPGSRPEPVQAPEDRRLAGPDPSPDPPGLYEGVTLGDLVVRGPYGSDLVGEIAADDPKKSSRGFATKKASGTRASAASRVNTRRPSRTVKSSACGGCVSLCRALLTSAGG
jgi:hypothetical protein